MKKNACILQNPACIFSGTFLPYPVGIFPEPLAEMYSVAIVRQSVESQILG
jgi:hypothetical protein